MKRQSNSLHLILRVLALTMAMPLNSTQATTIAVDFTGIPDGTPVSANNPYAGVVDFDGQEVIKCAAALRALRVSFEFHSQRYCNYPRLFANGSN